MHHVFGIRAAVLVDSLAEATTRDYLSGLLVGHECRAATASRPVHLVGSAALTARYEQALSLLAWPAMAILYPMSAPQFWIAPGAGMVSMVLLASCWSGTQGASYRLMGEAASLCLIVGFLGFNTLMG